jgi:hypothetical protein
VGQLDSLQLEAVPCNGRTLSDDAVDVFLPIVTDGMVTRDHVGPHKDRLTSFPYLGQPHQDRSAKLVARLGGGRHRDNTAGLAREAERLTATI